MGLLVIVICLALIWRMFDLQISKHAHYTALAVGQQRFEQTEMAQRGKIYAHDSSTDESIIYPLAFDVKDYSLWVVPNQVEKKDEAAAELEVLTGIPKQEIFDKINNDKLYIPPIKKGISYDDAQKIKDKNINGVFVMPEYSRFYPEATLASQVLGFVNSDGEGKYGFEGHYNNELKGKEGNIQGEKDTLGRVINLLDQKDPQDGTSYVLTISRPVQYFVEKKLQEAITQYQAESGTVVIMDVKTGGIVAMASLPEFDPNNYAAQANSDIGLFQNPAISYQFEPGSIFKPIVMASAIDKGLVNPDTSNVFGESVNVQGYTIHTAENKAFGQETMTQILQNSDNVGMVWVGQQLGKDAMYQYIKNFGFLDKTGIDLTGEAPGQAPVLKQWYDITQATISFGQGISVTPIELLAAYGAIANGGKYIYPHMVDKILLPDGTEKKVEKQEGNQVISKETSDKVKEMLYNVVMNGTAKKAQVPGFKIAAKTGTAQIADPNGQGYLDDPSKLGIYNHSAAGFAPANDPRFVMLVKLTKPKTSKYAESTAVPLFGEISAFLLNNYYRLTPTEPIANP